jgi:hypothetical protein
VKNTIASARSYLRVRLQTWMFLRAHLVKGTSCTLSDDWRRNQPLILSRQILRSGDRKVFERRSRRSSGWTEPICLCSGYADQSCGPQRTHLECDTSRKHDYGYCVHHTLWS